jgi:hypothetical protein
MRIQISLSGSIVEGGLYSSVKPIGSCIQKFKNLLNVISEYEPDREKLHCTVLYSRNKNGVSGVTESERVYSANIVEFTSWKGHDDKLYLVALLDSPMLQKAFRDWRELGYTSDYPVYKPHITIKKGLTQAEADRAADFLTLEYFKNPFILTFGSQQTEPLRD